jgi:DNA-directed RNA polymerase sigma subunit (sigma70/sigma32)
MNLERHHRRVVARLLELRPFDSQVYPPRWESVLTHLYRDGLTRRQVAERLSITPDRVRQIEMQALGWVRRTVTKDTPEGVAA